MHRLVALPLLAAACAAPGPRTTAGAEAFVRRYLQVLESRDERAIRSVHVADGRFAWFTDGERRYGGVDEVLASLRRYEGARFDTGLDDVRVVALGRTHAAVRSRFRTVLTTPDGGTHGYGGVITWLLERDRAGGRWRVLQGHTSTPAGPPDGTSPSRG